MPAPSSDPKLDGTLIRGAAVDHPVTPAAGDLDAATRSTTAFGLDVLKALTAADGADHGKNEMVSPVSLATALGMLAPGARGATASEISKVLHTQLPVGQFDDALGALNAGAVKRVRADGGTLQQSDALWTQKGYGIQQTYLDALSSAFDTGVHETDFSGNPGQALQQINGLVSQQTNGLIHGLFSPSDITRDTRFVLTDAIYFKADWASPFKASSTSDKPFHPLAGDPVNVPTMTQELHDSYGSGPGWQAVELPYKGNHLAMDIVLPDAETLDAFRGQLDDASLTRMLGSMQAGTPVDLTMPKFTFDSGASLDETLKKLGMPTVFGQAADLGGIPASGDPLHVDAVVEKAHVAVDEQGTTAAAAVGIGGAAGAAAPMHPPVVMTVDRPFLFLIRDVTTGQVQFLGQVTNPNG